MAEASPSPSVTEIVNMISSMMVAFVSISLAVSSIMIGVITYISVLERRKEIGILRAIGASKHNVSQVFNAETFIIGLCSGVMGVVLMLICAMMTSVSIVREKETGTMEILLASPMRPIHIILSKMTPYFTLSVTNVVTRLLLAVFVMGVPVRGSLLWLAVVSAAA